MSSEAYFLKIFFHVFCCYSFALSIGAEFFSLWTSRKVTPCQFQNPINQLLLALKVSFPSISVDFHACSHNKDLYIGMFVALISLNHFQIAASMFSFVPIFSQFFYGLMAFELTASSICFLFFRSLATANSENP